MGKVGNRETEFLTTTFLMKGGRLKTSTGAFHSSRYEDVKQLLDKIENATKKPLLLGVLILAFRFLGSGKTDPLD
ncbi:hypothetical protein BVE84_01335 [Streptococcus azizii]|uniref:Uncharacterized protein n=1 Tax=Streptococcus azizii TaxID=1579424 RepID=A0ABX3IFN3_9STRE|nr:hypothetical protein BVE85_01335 [Streptococcus azizii]ONK30737.1 hypothetical protein BVE84_01335 [Streptococcus azizii]